MYLLCLGNSGTEYRNQVHNIGFIFEKMCGMLLKSKFQDKFTEYYSKNLENIYKLDTYTIVKNISIKFLIFYGYINLTGYYLKENIDSLQNFKKEELIVVYDDITITTNSILMTFAKGSGLHNGARGIDNSLHKNYWRMRVGYKKPKEISANQFVLSTIDENYNRIFFKNIEFILLHLINFIKKYNNEKSSVIALQEYINRTFKCNN